MKRLLPILFLASLLLAINLPWGLANISDSPLPLQAATPALEANQSPQQWMQQGRESYQQEQFSAAATALEQAVRGFEQQGDWLQAAIARSNLSLVYQQLGEWQQAEAAIATSLASLEALQTGAQQPTEVWAQALNIEGRLWYQRGQLERAQASWEKAATLFAQANNASGKLGSQINQVQALQGLGLYQQGRERLETLRVELAQLPDSIAKARGWRGVGEMLRAVGELNQAQQALSESLSVATRLDAVAEIQATQLSLGNLLRSRGDLERDRRTEALDYDALPWQLHQRTIPKQAIAFYQQAEAHYQAASAASAPTDIRVKAQIGRLGLLIERQQLSAARTLWPEIDLEELPASRTAIYARIQFARHLADLKQLGEPGLTWDAIAQHLQTANQMAATLKDRRAQSNALGNLGSLYEYLGRTGDPLARQAKSFKPVGWAPPNTPSSTPFSFSQTRDRLAQPTQNKTKGKSQPQSWQQAAEQLTEQALFLVQPIEAPDLAYRWQWQLGRLAQAQGQRQSAIAAYRQATETLERARGDLLAINADVQFSFRDNVEPVYRQLVDLLLNAKGEPSPRELEQALSLIDSLQLAELESFLRCTLSVQLSEETVDPAAAIFYPILLKDRLEVIVSLPGQPLKHFTAPNSDRDRVEKTVKTLRKELQDPGLPGEVRHISQPIYQWLIKPLEADLAQQPQLDTLVFVLEGLLRNLPMNSLYDGKQYLVERYAIAVTPGISLLGPKPLQRKTLTVLTAGISERQSIPDVANFSALPNVPRELQQIQAQVPRSEKLLNRTFTNANLRSTLDNRRFSVVHMATHGKFSSDPENTYLLTYQDILKSNEMRNLLAARSQEEQEAIELLVLSACQTAQGDRRAALGLAGLAISAGARSTLATLWRVDDRATADLMVQFYKILVEHPDLTKAKALQQVQINAIADDTLGDPYYWSPFILVGNWL